MGLAIIYLYDSTVKTFIYNGQPLPQAYDVVVDRTLNDEFFVVGKHPLDTKNKYKDIQKDKIIKAHTPDGMQPFRIMDVTKGLGYVEFESWPLLYADLRSKLVKPFTIKKGTGQHTLNTFVSQLLLPADFSFTSNILTTHDFIVRDATEAEQDPDRLYDALDVLKRIVKRWNAEVIIDGFDIRLVNRLGKDTDALLYEKKNITDFMDNESLKNIVTRVHGKAEWTEDGPDGKLVTKRLTAQVDSPLINEYSGIVFEQQFTNNDVRTQQQLNDWLNLKFTTENLDKPSRTIELDTNIVDDTKIALGDKLNLKYLKHDVDMLIRMTRYQYDGFNNRYLKTYVGDAAEQFTGSVQNSITSSETNIKNSVDKKVANIIVNELGQKIIYSEVKPEGNFREGDTWFDEKGGMFIWDEASANWIPHPYNRRLDVVAQEIEENNKQLEAEKVRIDQTITKADQAVADSGLAKVDASNAITNANQAITDASKALTDASTSLAQSGQAKADASLAVTNAANAVTQAQTADGKANSALTKANAAITELGTTNTKVSNLESGYNELTNTVSLKADATTVNAVKGTVDNHTLAISANEQALTLKASSSEVNTLKGTVSDHSLAITAQADALTLKASQTEVNTIKGTVDQHSLDIAANAREVSLRLTSTQVNSLVEGKNYVNQTELKATSDGLSLDITKVSTDLENLEVGGRNLVVYKEGFSAYTSYNSNPTVSGYSIETTINITGNLNIAMRSNSFRAIQKPNSKYVISGYFYLNDEPIPADFFVRGFNTSGHMNQKSIEIDENGYTVIVFETGSETSSYLFHTELKAITGDILRIDELKVGKGNIATDWTPAPEDMATLAQYTSLKTTVDGLSLDIYKRVDALDGSITSHNSRITANAQGLALKADSTTVNELNKTVNKHTLDIKANSDGLALTAKKSYIDTVKQTVDQHTLDIQANADAVSLRLTSAQVNSLVNGKNYVTETTLEATASGIRTTVSSKADKSELTQLSTVVQSKVSSTEYNSKITQLDKDINLRVSKADLLTQINLSAETSTITLSGKLIQLDGDTTMTNAFANKIKAVEVIADKITSGTLNAAKVNIINLDVENLVGNRSWFVQSAWNGVSSSVFIDSNSLWSQNTAGDISRVQAGEIRSYNYGSSASAILGQGRAQFYSGGTSLFYLGRPLRTAPYAGILEVTHNESFAIGRAANYETTDPNAEFHPYISLDYTTSGNESSAIVRVHKALRLNKTLYMANGGNISNAYEYSFMSGGKLYALGSTSELRIESSQNMRLSTSQGTAFLMDNSYGYLYRNLSMEGNSITNQSDRRLKNIFGETAVDSLEAISKWTFVDYEWKDPHKHGSHLGLIAQDTPELMIHDKKRDIYSIDSSKQGMMNSHAIQQLYKKQENTSKVASHAMILADKHEDELACYKKRIKILEDKVKQLEGVA